jgi:hypothetical protein
VARPTRGEERRGEPERENGPGKREPVRERGKGKKKRAGLEEMVWAGSFYSFPFSFSLLYPFKQNHLNSNTI